MTCFQARSTQFTLFLLTLVLPGCGLGSTTGIDPGDPCGAMGKGDLYRVCIELPQELLTTQPDKRPGIAGMLPETDGSTGSWQDPLPGCIRSDTIGKHFSTKRPITALCVIPKIQSGAQVTVTPKLYAAEENPGSPIPAGVRAGVLVLVYEPSGKKHSVNEMDDPIDLREEETPDGILTYNFNAP